MSAARTEPTPFDPFDLPDDVGTGEVVWTSEDGLSQGHRVHGLLTAARTRMPCDLMAVDEAYPTPVASEALRATVHQAWRHGQVHLVSYAGRLTLLVPGTGLDAVLVLEAVTRLAKAVGASPGDFLVQLRLGD